MIVTGTVPKSVEDAFLTHPAVNEADAKSAWSVWAMSTASIHHGLRAAVLVGYQFSVPTPSSSLAYPVLPGPSEAADSASDAEVGPPVILEQAARPGASIQEITGGLGERLHDAVEQVRLLPEATDTESVWELRALHLPGIRLQALWLRSLAGEPDILLPYTTYTEGLTEFRGYSADHFLRAAARAAVKRPLVLVS